MHEREQLWHISLTPADVLLRALKMWTWDHWCGVLHRSVPACNPKMPPALIRVMSWIP